MRPGHGRRRWEGPRVRDWGSAPGGPASPRLRCWLGPRTARRPRPGRVGARGRLRPPDPDAPFSSSSETRRQAGRAQRGSVVPSLIHSTRTWSRPSCEAIPGAGVCIGPFALFNGFVPYSSPYRSLPILYRWGNGGIERLGLLICFPATCPREIALCQERTRGALGKGLKDRKGVIAIRKTKVGPGLDLRLEISSWKEYLDD